MVRYPWPMDREQARQALIEARRTRLTRVLGASPRTREIAERLVDADLLHALVRLLDEEAGRLDDLGLGVYARPLRGKAAGFHRRAERLEEEAARLEAECFPGCDRDRYLHLRSRIRRVRRDTDARNLANELLHGKDRLGRLAEEHLWELLRRTCRAGDIPFPADLFERFEERIAVEEAVAEEKEKQRTADDLLRRAQRLELEAATLEKEDLLDRIVAIGARLKVLQEDRERRDLPTDLPIPELDGEGQAIRKAFGILTRTSKRHQPGWTEVLDSRVRNLDWHRLARAAERRIRAREEERERLREEGRRRQVEEARRRWREEVRRFAFQEAVDRLRALLDRLGEGDGLREAARAEAAVACRLAEGDEERLERVAALLGGHEELVATGRAFRGLRRLLGLEPAAEDEVPAPEEGVPEPVEAEDPAEEAAEDAVEEAVGPWPDWVLERRDAGRGERVLLVGGLPDRRRLQVLEDFFGWEDTDWVESYREHSADFSSLKKQVREGRWDRVVALTRFCGHDVTQALSAATNRAKVPFLRHPRSATIPALAGTLYGPGRTRS